MQVPSSSSSPYPTAPQLTSALSPQTAQTDKTSNVRQMPLPATTSISDPSATSPTPKKARTYAVIGEASPAGSASSSPSAPITAATKAAAPLLSDVASGREAMRPIPVASISTLLPNQKRANDSSSAIEKLRQDALKGDAAAQTLLGNEYLKGEIFPQNYLEGVKWLRFAANQNFAMALGHLSVCYSHGIGVPRDAKVAAALYCKTASRCSVRGTLSIGYKFILGTGLINNYSNYFRYHLLPAQRGNRIAYNIVACCHLLGVGIQRNEQEGLRLLRLAAAHGDPLALFNLGECYELCLGINAQAEFPSLDFFQSVSKAKIKALEYYRQAADLGLALAQNALGFQYLHGFSVEYNPHEAARLSHQAALQGLPAAQTQWGDCLSSGTGVAPNSQEAMLWYRLAANQGDKGAIERLARYTDNPYEANQLYRRMWWNYGTGLEQINDRYYHLTVQKQIHWSLLFQLSHQYPAYIDIWKQDYELHERTGTSFIDALDAPTLRALPARLFVAIIERVCEHIHQTIQSAPFTEERLAHLKPALNFIPTLKTLCKEIKPPNETELLNRLTLALAEPYIALSDHLSALKHLKEIIHPCPEANVKLAKLLYICEGWRFPEIAQWQARYALIAALMASSTEELLEDENLIFHNVIESLEQSLQIARGNPSLLDPQLKSRYLQWLAGKPDVVKPFFDLLSRDNVDSYFRYHSMKIPLNEALAGNSSSLTPRNLQFLQHLSNTLELHLGRCNAYLPSLLQTHDIEALQRLVDCCLALAASNQPRAAFENMRSYLSAPLVQKWITIIPAFAVNFNAYLDQS